jgi:hypothetical protein
VQLKLLQMQYNNRSKQSEPQTIPSIMAKDSLSRGKARQILLCKPGAPTIADLQQQGFRTVKESRWTPEQVDAVKDFLQKLYLGTSSVETTDPYYFIAHHILQKSKSASEVKQFINNKFCNL